MKADVFQRPFGMQDAEATTVLDALAVVAGSLVAALGVTKPEEERWRFFVLRRGWGLYVKANWADGQNWDATYIKTQLKTKLQGELTKVKNFLSDELGSGSESLEQRTPPHLDIAEECRYKTNLKASANVVKTKTQDWKARRPVLASKIAIRALALHPDLWTSNGEINAEALREVIDRRLRVVERLRFNVNSGGGFDKQGRTSVERSWTITAEQAWLDGNRRRPFEYPYLDGNDPDTLLAAAAAAGLPASTWWQQGPREPKYQQQAGETWNWLWVKTADNPPRSIELTWNRAPPTLTPPPADPKEATNIRFPSTTLGSTALDSLWKVWLDNGHTISFMGPKQGDTALSSVIELLFRLSSSSGDTKTNLWDRSWLYCDHVLSLLHIEALLFARRRRLPVGTSEADSELDDLATTDANAPPPQNIWLGGMVEASGGTSKALLDGRQGNTYFQTRLRPAAELEIGDQVVFWNNAVYDLVSNAAARHENAMIVDIGANPDGSLDRNAVKISGHGVPERTIAGQQKSYADGIGFDLAEARAAVAKAGATATKVKLPSKSYAIKWSPYETITDGSGPWWLVYSLRSEFAPAEMVADAVLAIPRSIGVITQAGGQRKLVTAQAKKVGGITEATLVQIPAGTGFTSFMTPFPEYVEEETVLFPLFEPDFPHGETETRWAAYLASRATPPTGTRKAPKLRPMTVDSETIPGFIIRSTQAERNGMVRATSPRVRPT